MTKIRAHKEFRDFALVTCAASNSHVNNAVLPNVTFPNAQLPFTLPSLPFHQGEKKFPQTSAQLHTFPPPQYSVHAAIRSSESVRRLSEVGRPSTVSHIIKVQLRARCVFNFD